MSNRLCLNMIVRNETANLERCLSALVDHVDCWVIGDTLSTDGTPDLIKKFFGERNLPGEVHSFPFENFEQARNAALDCACASALSYDYLLFADADMELVVEDRGFRERLEAPGYRLLQRADSGLAYWNTRLVRRDAGARYHGVTHEYLDVPGGVQELRGVWYKDHASGSNRVDKFERDIKLLLEALKDEPENHRYWFYLAQSYRDAGRLAEAAKAYAKRAKMGGWDEEAWNARLQEARCLKRLGDEAGFLRAALAAFDQRPRRAEPLYDLARHYREKGMNEASVLFSEPGIGMKRPEEDILFLEDFVYMTGLKEEYSISANYSRDVTRKDRGFDACNWLALSREVPEGSRSLAWSNLHFYVQPAGTLMPSFSSRPIGFLAPEGYSVTNPSVARLGDRILLVQRTVNYTMSEDGLQYQTPAGSAIHTRNFLLSLDQELGIRESVEILPPTDLPPPVSQLVIGFEDMRLFSWRGALWCSSCLRELTPEAWCDQVLARVDRNSEGGFRLSDWRVLRPEGERVHEKNWMPRVDGNALQFVYLCDPTRVLDEGARTVSEYASPLDAKNFRGGSQLIGFGGGWLALIHEVQWRASERRRYYYHRFVWFDKSIRLQGVSRPFFFNRKGIEFAAGLTWHPDGTRLLISYGVADSEAWIALVDAAEVHALFEPADDLPFGLPPTPASPAPMAASQRAASEPCSKKRKSWLGASDGIGLAPNARSEKLEGTDIKIAKSNEQVAAPRTPNEFLLEFAPFLRSVESPRDRREASRTFDARLPALLDHEGASLPQIHCFYEALSETDEHRTLIAAVRSMRFAGHPVRVWSYSPQRLEFLRALGADLRTADEVMPRSLFERIISGREIRYVSDVFRYAVLYEHGGLWMDTDMILLRPFPFRGDHFLNLQWRGGHKGHYICGNVIYAKPYSRHLESLYNQSIERVFSRDWEFGLVGPKLLSDYVASEAGAELTQGLFSPMLFNSIDWMETDRFDKPTPELADYLNDERVFGIHLWTARNEAKASGDTLISLLTDPAALPHFTDLADRFNTDKNRHTGNRHCYARIYDRLFSSRRFSIRRLMEIGLCRGRGEHNQTETPSVALWQSYFPFCQVIGVDLTDFSRLHNEHFTSFVCDQSKPEELRAVATKLEPASLDVIIDDGSRASYDQQITLREFWPLLADGGWFFVEDLDWQPPGEDATKITLTKTLLREIQKNGVARSIDPHEIGRLAEEFAEILFFDSHYELSRAKLMGGLVAIRKRGGAGFVR